MYERHKRCTDAGSNQSGHRARVCRLWWLRVCINSGNQQLDLLSSFCLSIAVAAAQRRHQRSSALSQLRVRGQIRVGLWQRSRCRICVSHGAIVMIRLVMRQARTRSGVGARAQQAQRERSACVTPAAATDAL
jgi:hypothetical protein